MYKLLFSSLWKSESLRISMEELAIVFKGIQVERLKNDLEDLKFNVRIIDIMRY